ncbi:RING-H2 finger protein ATL40-like [Malania oleifera]|uniref:RING-H2 finger protein ATL40-like n=1 Tax=Malania oleifera TaxID=397392 RepID=UPI0025AE39F3|nr:RING-H2 finger protein ATL40-like [Malania oleifera]
MSFDANKFGSSHKIFIAAIIILCLIVILVSIFHLYIKFLLRCRQRRHHASSLYPLDIEAAQSELGLSEGTSTGLDRLVMDSLPVFIYGMSHELDRDEGTECPVCLGAIVEGAKVRLLPSCKHLFHVECIDMWLSSQTTCPICRTPVQPKSGDLGAGVEPTAPPLEERRPDDAA